MEEIITVLKMVRRGFEDPGVPRRWKFIWLEWALVILKYNIPKIQKNHHYLHSSKLRVSKTTFYMNFIFNKSRKIKYQFVPKTILLSFVKWLQLEAVITLWIQEDIFLIVMSLLQKITEFLSSSLKEI